MSLQMEWEYDYRSKGVQKRMSLISIFKDFSIKLKANIVNTFNINRSSIHPFFSLIFFCFL